MAPTDVRHVDGLPGRLKSMVASRRALVGVFMTVLASPAAAQLRPYEPFEWGIFDESSATLGGSVGSVVLWDQRASLAGTQGRLAEIGKYHGFLRSGRIALEIGGAAYRVLHETEPFADPTGGAEGAELGVRTDHGDHLVTTSVLLSNPANAAAAVLRFGSRLPTTDNTVGLDRDALDFYALMGGRFDRGGIRAAAEVGLGIHGTRLSDFEQSDIFIYLLSLTASTPRVRPSLLVLGQTDAVAWPIRGNEELAEVRVRLRTGEEMWLQVEAIKGLTPFSPGLGFSFAIGAVR